MATGEFLIFLQTLQSLNTKNSKRKPFKKSKWFFQNLFFVLFFNLAAFRWSVFFEKADHLASMHSCIADYSFAQATLEEAFLRLSQQGDDHIERVERHVLPLSTLL